MSRSPIELKDLTYFVAVYESRNASRAASLLDTVQSNVSMRIAALERQLGVSLFERHYRGLVPTASGKKLYESALPLIGGLRKLERTAMRWGKRRKNRKLRSAA